ncbi:hypothetical protein SKAU_G00160910 [Synaphobranchus kaupii]|uniref:Uncharacterized protein n=1 Tax=Synaphobranchus kaupii TaxID=118154 RepID=A0A9Q1IYW1_SYNKA|nr:hypothetical protein SKAU_G00160910 [Synaphobranchus kaupii]
MCTLDRILVPLHYTPEVVAPRRAFNPDPTYAGALIRVSGARAAKQPEPEPEERDVSDVWLGLTLEAQARAVL